MDAWNWSAGVYMAWPMERRLKRWYAEEFGLLSSKEEEAPRLDTSNELFYLTVNYC